MPNIPIRQLGERGITPDLPPFELQPNEFSAGRNVRFANGAAQTMPAPANLETLAAAPVWGAGWLAGGVSQLAYASANQLYVREDGDFVLRSDSVNYPSGYAGSDWQSEIWGESILFNNGTDVPQFKSPTDVTFGDLPNWPATLRAKTVRKYRNFMVALGITEGGTSYPNTIAWSTEAEPGQVPWTWDASDLSGLAGRNPVDSGAGELIDCLELGGANIIYTRTAAYLMQEVGGQFVFTFNKIFDKGILCRNAVASFDNYHLVVGAAEIFIHDGSSTRSVAHRRVNRTFYSELADRESVRCVTNAKTKEVWIFYTTTEGPANRALVYNWLDDTYTFVDVPKVVCPVFAPRQGDVTTWAELAGLNWADLTQSWGDFADTSVYPVMYYFCDDGVAPTLMEADFLNTSVDTQAVYLERTGIDLDDLLGAPTSQWKLLRRIVPQISGRGLVKISVGISSGPNDPVRWKQSKLFDVASDLKVDCRVKARYLAIKIESAGAGFWRLTGWDLDLMAVDGR